MSHLICHSWKCHCQNNHLKFKKKQMWDNFQQKCYTQHLNVLRQLNCAHTPACSAHPRTLLSGAFLSAENFVSTLMPPYAGEWIIHPPFVTKSLHALHTHCGIHVYEKLEIWQIFSQKTNTRLVCTYLDALFLLNHTMGMKKYVNFTINKKTKIMMI